MAGKIYAVKVGRTPGIYGSWEDCKAQVEGFPGATFKSFNMAADAAKYMGWGCDMSTEKLMYDEEEPKNTKLIDKKNGTNNTKLVDGAQEEILFDCGDKNDNIAYVDGSYNVATGEFSYGVVMFHEGQKLHFSRKYDDKELAEMRNVAGEIKGAEAAMEYAYRHGMSSITIYHDYEGISKWPLRQWKANKSGTKEYQSFYDKISENVKIKFVKVKGHSGDTYNDEADRLAKEALGL